LDALSITQLRRGRTRFGHGGVEAQAWRRNALPIVAEAERQSGARPLAPCARDTGVARSTVSVHRTVADGIGDAFLDATIERESIASP
jgi:hypothetical protein